MCRSRILKLCSELQKHTEDIKNQVREHIGKHMEWKAKWIWDNGESRPGNHWLCYRKSFELQCPLDMADLYITADSRYVVFVNNCLIRAGPVRGWPSEQFYDWQLNIISGLKRNKHILIVFMKTVNGLRLSLCRQM